MVVSKLKMNCGYCGRKCDLDKDFCIPQDSVYVCKSCYEWQRRVADLESKLIEKEKEVNQRKEMFIALQEQCAKDIKDKEIEIHCWKCSAKDWKKHHEKVLDDLVRITNKVDQVKIKFAIEQLEKARNLLFDAPYEFDSEEWCWVEEQLDNQIKQLKEGK